MFYLITNFIIYYNNNLFIIVLCLLYKLNVYVLLCPICAIKLK